MVTVPDWIASSVDEFGKGMGLRGLRLNEDGAVSFTFENGFHLGLEYAYESLTMILTAKAEPSDAEAARQLAEAHPTVRRSFRVRVGYLAASGEAAFAVRMPEREVDLVALTSAFQELWRMGEGLKS